MKTVGQRTRDESFMESRKAAGTCRARILEFIRNNPECTRSQISDQMDIAINSVTGRVNELIKDNLVQESGITECPFSGRKVATLKTISVQEVG